MTTLLNEMLERLHGAIEANRRFAADASHELRSPLTAMTGEIDVTLKRHRSAPEYRETLEVVRERLTEMAALADNLMVLVRAQEESADGIVKEVSLIPLIEASVQRVAPMARARDVTISLDAVPDLIVYGDARLLARVVDNLLSNAVIYNRDGGEVVIGGRFHESARDAWEAGAGVLTIADTGVGVPEHERERIFERFHRLDQSRSRRTGAPGWASRCAAPSCRCSRVTCAWLRRARPAPRSRSGCRPARPRTAPHRDPGLPRPGPSGGRGGPHVTTGRLTGTSGL